MQKRFFNTMIKSAATPPITAPVFEDIGTFSIVAGSTSLDVSYNSTINVNNTLIILLQVFGNRTFTTPDGWTLLGSASGSRSSAAFIKRATGSETGTETCTISSSANITGQMVRYSGAATSGAFYEDNQGTVLVNSSTIDIPSLTTSGPVRKCVALYVIDDAQNPGDPTDYTEQFVESQVSYSTTFVGNDQEIATASTVDADSSSLSSSETHFVYAFALIPAA